MIKPKDNRRNITKILSKPIYCRTELEPEEDARDRLSWEFIVVEDEAEEIQDKKNFGSKDF